MTACKKNVNKVSEIARHLMIMAEECISNCEHDECLLLHGVLTDAAYKVLSAAERCGGALEERASVQYRSYPRKQDAGFRGWEANV